MSYAFYALLTMIFWGAAPIFRKIGLAQATPFASLALRSFVISILLLVAGFASGELSTLSQMPMRSALFIAAEGIFASLLGHLAYFYALKNGEATQVIPITSAFPVITFILAYLILRESISIKRIIGIAMVVIGVLLTR